MLDTILNGILPFIVQATLITLMAAMFAYAGAAGIAALMQWLKNDTAEKLCACGLVIVFATAFFRLH